MTPLGIDLFCGLGGWSDGLLAEGFDVIGFDIERHAYGDHAYPAQLVLQDVLTLHGSQFRDASLIVASPPCQEYSYMAMPWSRAKEIAKDYRSGAKDVRKLTALFRACFRIQREACAAAGHFIPLVVENVRGAQPWVGRSNWNYGSFHLWGDVPALMPMTKAVKGRLHGWTGGSRESDAGVKVPGMNWSDRSRPAQAFNGTAIRNLNLGDGIKQHKSGRAWFSDPDTMSGKISSKSPARKAASALIAKIPFALSRYIAAVYRLAP